MALRGIFFKVDQGEIVQRHTAANLGGELAASVPKGSTEDVLLGRLAVGTWPSNEEARAWLDASKGLELETNDDLLVRKWVLLPERVEELGKKTLANNDLILEYRKDIALYSEQIKAHLAAVRAMSKAMKDIRDLVARK